MAKRISERAKVLCGTFHRAATMIAAGRGEWRIAVQCSIGRDITSVSIVTVPGDTFGREAAIDVAKEKALYPNLSIDPGVKIMAACMASDAVATGA